MAAVNPDELKDDMRKKLLITGASGIVGTGLRPFLRPHYDLLLFSRSPAPEAQEGETVLTGDMASAADVQAAVAQADAVLHLAAVHGLTISFEETLDVNYRGLTYLMEACVVKGLHDVVFASSNHGWGFHPISTAPLAETAPPRPDGWYGINKIWGEAVMAYYADAHGMRTTSLRIGNTAETVKDDRRLHMWISFADLAAVTLKALERNDKGHRAIYSTADCPDPYFDNHGMRDLGHAPQDRPEDNLPEGFDPTPGPSTLIGGEFAEANIKRRKG